MKGWENKSDIGIEDSEFKTPRWLTDFCVQRVMHLLEIRGIPTRIVDPCAGDGVWGRSLNQYMAINSHWGISFNEYEITQGSDFYKQNTECDVLIGNPPFSNLTKWLEHSTKTARLMIAYVLPAHSLSNKRLEMMESFGWRLQSIHSFPNPKEWGLGYPHFFCIWITGERRWFGSHVLSDCLNGPADCIQRRLTDYASE
jgi:hypothetical protein